MVQRFPWWCVGSGAGIVLLCCALKAAGHGDTPPVPQAPQVNLTSTIVDQVYPPRWSWLHWWEANRDPYLVMHRQVGGVQKPDTTVEQKRKEAVAAALQEALKSASPPVRGWAALALGRTGDPAQVPLLTDSLSGETDETVRCMLLVGLGLAGGPEAEHALATGKYATDAQRLAGLAGVGLLAKPDGSTIVGVQAMLQSRNAGWATMAAWVLEHQDIDSAQPLYDVLRKTESPWLASSAILSLGRQRRSEAIPVLAGILLYTPDAQHLPVISTQMGRDGHLRALMMARKAQDEASREKNAQIPAIEESYRKSVEEYKNKWDPNYVAPPMEVHVAPPVIITLGYELTAVSQLRASAAIALGNFSDPAARQALMDAITFADIDLWKSYSDLYKGQAIMALGRIADRQGARLLADILQQRRIGTFPPLAANSPLRAYAALALGLYCRPADDQNSPEREGYAEICRMLGERYADNQETEEVRCASAMALGLTARTENLRYLQGGFSRLRPAEQLIGAYALLARGMLGDHNIIDLARNLLATDQQNPDMSGILARRAAVLGLSLLGSEEVIPILCKAWDLNYYVNREVAFSFACLGLTSVADVMVKELKTNPGIPERAYFARCLGELYTAERPARLALFNNGSNYTIKNQKMNSAQALANEFLYNYLIPSFGGDQWR